MTTDNALWRCACPGTYAGWRAPEEDYCDLCLTVRPGAGVVMPGVRHRLDIPIKPARLNELMSQHWGVAARMKQLYADHVSIAKVKAGVPVATGRRRVHLTIRLTYRQRRADPDAWWKVVLDALVKAKLLKDDNPKWCVLAPVEYERGTVSGSVIVLEEIEDE